MNVKGKSGGSEFGLHHVNMSVMQLRRFGDSLIHAWSREKTVVHVTSYINTIRVN